MTRPLEHTDKWPQIVDQLDDVPLKELAERFEVKMAEIASAMRRTGTGKTPQRADGPRVRLVRPEEVQRRKEAEMAANESKSKGDDGSEAWRDDVGTMSDEALAERAGVKVETVTNFREFQGIDPYEGDDAPSGDDVSEGDASGDEPGDAAASDDAVGATGGDDLPAPRPGSKDAQLLPYWDELGAIPDGEIADKAGVSAATVGNFRDLHGIDAYQRGSDDDTGSPPSDDDGKPEPRPGSKDAQILAHWDDLGEVPDGEIAERAGVSAATVFNFRKLHDIDAYERGSDADDTQSTTKGSPGRTSKLEPFRHLLGQVPDRVVADKADLTVAAVRSYRYRHDIPAPSKVARQQAATDEAPAGIPTDEAAATTAAPEGAFAWRIQFDGHGPRIVVADDIAQAAARAAQAELGDVTGLERLERVVG